jgi:Flp pilus assembly protein TadD
LSSIGQAQLDAGELDRAEASLRRSVDLHRTLFPEGNPDTAYPLTALGSTLLASGRLDEAEAVLREALRLRIDYLPSDHWLLASSRGLLGECLVRRGETEEGSALLRASLRGLESAFGPDDERTRQARERLSTWTTEE